MEIYASQNASSLVTVGPLTKLEGRRSQFTSTSTSTRDGKVAISCALENMYVHLCGGGDVPP